MKHRNIPQNCPTDPLNLVNVPIHSDVFGSYTGLVKEADDLPVQDADDL